MPRLAHTPLAEVLATLGRARRAPIPVIIRGTILPLRPHGTPRLELPHRLDEHTTATAADTDREPVLARIDLEEPYEPFVRPVLLRLDRGRDFYVGDESGQALVRIASPEPPDPLTGPIGLLDDGVEVHLETVRGPYAVRAVRARQAWVRTLRVGDPVVVIGAATLEEDLHAAGLGGYRASPSLPVLRPGRPGPTGRTLLHVYDEAAFLQATAWRALPWYRKLSILFGNR